MARNSVFRGSVIQHTVGADTAAGDVVVIGSMLGVALNDIANGQTGPCAISGVFVCPKVSTAVIGQGESLVWVVASSEFDDQLATPVEGDISGVCAVAWEAAGNGATTVKVLLTGLPGAVEPAP